jgi:hypothetical protein
MIYATLSDQDNVHRLSKNVLAAKQSITITGLGCDAFSKSARAILEIHSLFASALPPDSLQMWTPLMDENCICLEFSNRYLTPVHEADLEAVDLGPEIDPVGILASNAQGGIYTEDNVVTYFETIKNEDR